MAQVPDCEVFITIDNPEENGMACVGFVPAYLEELILTRGNHCGNPRTTHHD